jgi:hypothetical protein
MAWAFTFAIWYRSLSIDGVGIHFCYMVPEFVNRWHWHAFFPTKIKAYKWLTPEFFIQVEKVATDGTAIQFRPPKLYFT